MRRRHLAASLAAPALAQEAFPGSRTLTLMVGFAAGGAADMTMRALAESIRQKRGAQAVIDIRPGAGSALSLERLSRLPPDGTQVALGSPSAWAIIPQQQNVGYDPLALTALGQMSAHPLPIYVRADSPHRDWAGLLAFARANPGRLSWGTAGARGLAEISVEAAFRHEGVQTASVPFRGGAEAIVALLGGHIDAVASSDFGPLLAQGSVRLLVETGPARIPGHEALPTFRDLGYPMSLGVTYGVLGPPAMPPGIVQWWQAAIRELCDDPAFAATLRQGYAVPAFLDAAGYQALIRDGHAAFGRVLRG